VGDFTLQGKQTVVNLRICMMRIVVTFFNFFLKDLIFHDKYSVLSMYIFYYV
jgi:hypothetical protein